VKDQYDPYDDYKPLILDLVEEGMIIPSTMLRILDGQEMVKRIRLR
jgi:hypothetical protein